MSVGGALMPIFVL